MESEAWANCFALKTYSRRNGAEEMIPSEEFPVSRSVSPVHLGTRGRKKTLNLRIGVRDWEEDEIRDEDYIPSYGPVRAQRPRWQLPATREELMLRYSSQSVRAQRAPPLPSYKRDATELLLSRLAKHYAKFLRIWLQKAQEAGMRQTWQGDWTRRRRTAHSSRPTQLLQRERPLSKGDLNDSRGCDEDDSFVPYDSVSPLHTEPTMDLSVPTVVWRPLDKPGTRLSIIAEKAKRIATERLAKSIAAVFLRTKKELLAAVLRLFRKETAASQLFQAMEAVLESRVREFFAHELFAIPKEQYRAFQRMARAVRKLASVLAHAAKDSALRLLLARLLRLAHCKAKTILQVVVSRRQHSDFRAFFQSLATMSDKKRIEQRQTTLRRSFNRVCIAVKSRQKELQQAAFIALWRNLRLPARAVRPRESAQTLRRALQRQCTFRLRAALRTWRTARRADVSVAALIFRIAAGRQVKLSFSRWRKDTQRRSSTALLVSALKSVTARASIAAWYRLGEGKPTNPPYSTLACHVFRRVFRSRLELAFHILQKNQQSTAR